MRKTVIVFLSFFALTSCDNRISEARRIMDDQMAANDSSRILIKEIDSLRQNMPSFEKDTSGRMHNQ